jgi:hypothetical protein
MRYSFGNGEASFGGQGDGETFVLWKTRETRRTRGKGASLREDKEDKETGRLGDWENMY